MELLFKISMISLGIFIFILDFLSLARRKMYPTFSVIWSLFAFVLIVLGILLNPSELNKYMSLGGLIFIIIAAFALVISIYVILLHISTLISKNQELATQVALIKEELNKKDKS